MVTMLKERKDSSGLPRRKSGAAVHICSCLSTSVHDIKTLRIGILLTATEKKLLWIAICAVVTLFELRSQFFKGHNSGLSLPVKGNAGKIFREPGFPVTNMGLSTGMQTFQEPHRRCWSRWDVRLCTPWSCCSWGLTWWCLRFLVLST